MKKQTKKFVVIAVVIAIVIAIVVYFLVKGSKDPQTAGDPKTMSSPAGGSGAPLGRNVPTQITDCSNWKEQSAIQKGLKIDPMWIKRYGIDDCTILGWMYHIKYETDWGRSLSGEKLFQDAEFQAHQANQ